MLRNLGFILFWRIEHSWVKLSIADCFARLSHPWNKLRLECILFIPNILFVQVG